jgi:hypothetical protein
MSVRRPRRFTKEQLADARKQIATEEAISAARNEVRRERRLQQARTAWTKIRRPLLVGVLCVAVPMVSLSIWTNYRIASCKKEQYFLGAAEFNKLPVWARKYLTEEEFLQHIPNATQLEIDYARHAGFQYQVPDGLYWIFYMYDYFYDSDNAELRRASEVVWDLRVVSGSLDEDGVWTPGEPTSEQLNRFTFACRAPSLWGSPILPDGYSGKKVFSPWPTPDFDRY